MILVIAISFIARIASCNSDTFICARILNVKSAFKYADSLAIGCIGAFLYETRWPVQKYVRVKLLYGFLVILLASMFMFPATKLQHSVMITTQAVVVMVCISLSMSEKNTVLFKFLDSSRPMVYIGLISYSLYILAYAVSKPLCW